MDEFHQHLGGFAGMGRGDRELAKKLGGSDAITDIQVARLLLVLSEIDQCVAGFRHLPKEELSAVVLGAIAACGFTDPDEVRLVVATVLQAIEANDGVPALSPLGASA